MHKTKSVCQLVSLNIPPSPLLCFTELNVNKNFTSNVSNSIKLQEKRKKKLVRKINPPFVPNQTGKLFCFLSSNNPEEDSCESESTN